MRARHIVGLPLQSLGQGAGTVEHEPAVHHEQKLLRDDVGRALGCAGPRNGKIEQAQKFI